MNYSWRFETPLSGQQYVVNLRISDQPSACSYQKDKKSFIEKCRAGGCEINLVPRGDYFLTFIRDFDGNLFEIKEIEM